MITGDQQGAATEIARQLGLDEDAQGRALRVIHARQLSGLDAEGWLKIVAEAAVFARASPEHKLKIVDALQRQVLHTVPLNAVDWALMALGSLTPVAVVATVKGLQRWREGAR